MTPDPKEALERLEAYAEWLEEPGDEGNPYDRPDRKPHDLRALLADHARLAGEVTRLTRVKDHLVIAADHYERKGLGEVRRAEAAEAKLATLTDSVQSLVWQFEDGESHDEGAYDDKCEICIILTALRAALTEAQGSGGREEEPKRIHRRVIYCTASPQRMANMLTEAADALTPWMLDQTSEFPSLNCALPAILREEAERIREKAVASENAWEGLGKWMSAVMQRANALLTGRPGDLIGHENREAVREFFLAHVGCTNIECAQALSLSVYSVGRHVHTLRNEWTASSNPGDEHGG